MTDHPLSFGQIVQAHRKARGWSYEELGHRAHISGGYVKKLEDGDRASPGIEVAAKLAKALGLSLIQMLDIHFKGLEEVPELPEVRLERLVLKVLARVNRLLTDRGIQPDDVDHAADALSGNDAPTAPPLVHPSPPVSESSRRRRSRKSAEGR